MKKKENDKIDKNNKILESKKIIREEKKKIREIRKSARKKRYAKFKKTKFGKFLSKFFFLFNDEKNSYSFSELVGVSLFSLLLGIFVCFCIAVIITGGRNYFKMSKKFEKFYDVYNVLLENYYGNVDEDKLIEAAIEGMVSSVGDIYTNYNDSSETDAFNEMVNGTYEGIGCTIRQDDNKIVIVEVYDGTPASKAGLKENDIIKSVDGKDTSKLTVSEVSNYIKNEAEGKVRIVVSRDGKDLEFELDRAKVEIPSVTSKVFNVDDKKIGYISIEIFSSVSSKQFITKLDELEKEGISGLIIDVRDNNGGYLTAVTDITSCLLPKGKIIYQVQSGDKKTVTKDKTNEKRDYPIAIITNGNSASASEILAAAIKESYGGYVVGEKTYGKGTVQQVRKLSDGSMIKYTVENWLTPNGGWINEVGIEPTHEVKLSDEYYKTKTDEKDNQLQKAIELVSK